MANTKETYLLDSVPVVKKRRMGWLDYDKGITIILVGYGHCLATLSTSVPDLNKYPLFTFIGTFLYGFRMPLFFIVSGILVSSNLKKKGLPKYLVTRADLLYAMLIWGIIEITFKMLAHSDTVSYWSYLYLLTDPRQTGHFWYLNALFCIGSLYSILKASTKLKPVHQIFIGLALYAISSYILVNDIRGGFLTDIGRYYFFFALGDFASVWLRDENRQRSLSTWKLFVPLLIIFSGLQYYCTVINLQHIDYGSRFVEVKLPALYLVEAIVGCATSLSLSFLLQKHNIMRWLTTIGTYSLFIYLMQIIVMSFSRTALQHLHLNTPALIISIWVIGTLLPIVLYKTFMQYGFWWLFSFQKPEPYVKVKILSIPARLKNLAGKKEIE